MIALLAITVVVAGIPKTIKIMMMFFLLMMLMFFLHFQNINPDGINPPLVPEVIGNVAIGRVAIAVDAHAKQLTENWRGRRVVVIDRVGLV